MTQKKLGGKVKAHTCKECGLSSLKCLKLNSVEWIVDGKVSLESCQGCEHWRSTTHENAILTSVWCAVAMPREKS